MQPNPVRVLEVGLGFLSSKTLLSAVELKVFTRLGQGAATAAELARDLGLHPRSARDFLDALVALGLLERAGQIATATYSNTPETAALLDEASPAYIGGILELANDRLYRFWADLTQGLKTGEPQNEVEQNGNPFFLEIYSDPDRLAQFIRGMASIQRGNFLALAETFDFRPYRCVCDVGGADGLLCVTLAEAHPHLRLQSFDLPPVAALARQRIEAAGLADRIEVVAGDFFVDPWPCADVITMGNVLHNWGLDEKKLLIRRAHESLSDGGALVAIENLIDDDRRNNAFGLLMSLNMLLETPAGFDYTGADFDEWCREAGFRTTHVAPLTGPTSAAIAIK